MITHILRTAGYTLTTKQARQFEQYAALLIEHNKKYNLTALNAPEEIAVLHFLDSLTVLPFLSAGGGGTFADVGTGAGFPGAALAIMRPDIHFTLIDSTQKKIRFLQTLNAELGLLNVSLVCARVGEKNAANAALINTFDYAAARAVAPMQKLCKPILPMLKPGGVFIAMKGQNYEDELVRAAGVITKKGCVVEEIKEFTLQNTGSQAAASENYARALIIIRRNHELT